MSLRALLFVPGLISAFFAVGCGGGGVPVETLVPVGGTLLVDGKPLDGVEVTFIPEVTKNRRGGTGTTDAAGAFTITDLEQNQPGLPVGKYSIAYSRMRLPDGSAGPKPGEGQPANPGLIRVETLPSHLTTPDPKVPPNQVEIPKDGNTKLELKISATPPPVPM
ncbi:MAG: hypothetical protein ACKVT0_05030 [Planctomycetaceae bacterium]